MLLFGQYPTRHPVSTEELDLRSSSGEQLRFICQQKATLPGCQVAGPPPPGLPGTSMAGLLIFHQQYIE
ncbi:hypothetical protein N7449_003186 [Penicillium cf. viridicatum]|uniref:Uncharacterized protein n=1 Tax=Penicillium cf. viridicatum TaxID=2972119 RepID=A0A9W9MWS6_9EURO|nr:hypothetical protein N7449_003186 [Penicillium cf. viridicatum]